MADKKEAESMPIPVWSAADYAQARKEIEGELQEKPQKAIDKTVNLPLNLIFFNVNFNLEHISIEIQKYDEKLFKVRILYGIGHNEAKEKTGLVTEDVLKNKVFALADFSPKDMERGKRKEYRTSKQLFEDFLSLAAGWTMPENKKPNTEFPMVNGKYLKPEEYVVSRLKDDPNLQLRIYIPKANLLALKKMGPYDGTKKWAYDFGKVRREIQINLYNTKTNEWEGFRNILIQMGKGPESEKEKRAKNT